MFQKLNSLYHDFGLHDSWPFCHALFSRKFLFTFFYYCTLVNDVRLKKTKKFKVL